MQKSVFTLIRNLGSAKPPIRVRLVTPLYLEDPSEVALISTLGSVIEAVTQPLGSGRFTVSKEMSNKDRSSLVPKTLQAQRALALLALGDAIQADALVTNNPALVATRYTLLHHHRARIIPLAECIEWIQACGIGHGVFVAASDAEARIPPALHYLRTHPKSRRLADWFLRHNPAASNGTLHELLRSAIFNRYPFILYARDMLRFYELQSDYFARRGLRGVFTLQIGFFMTSFYLNLWGMLDHLTAIARELWSLDVDERRCGIMSKHFWQSAAVREPALRKIGMIDIFLFVTFRK